jgi:hypothetical protein
MKRKNITGCSVYGNTRLGARCFGTKNVPVLAMTIIHNRKFLHWEIKIAFLATNHHCGTRFGYYMPNWIDLRLPPQFEGFCGNHCLFNEDSNNVFHMDNSSRTYMGYVRIWLLLR